MGTVRTRQGRPVPAIIKAGYSGIWEMSLKRFIRKIFDVLPTPIQWRLKCICNSLLTIVNIERRHIWVRKQNGFWKIYDTSTSIFIYTPNRCLMYARGIQTHMGSLAEEYGWGVFYDLNPNDIIFDIGANVGEFSIFASEKQCNVFAFEADRPVFNILRRNLGHYPKSRAINRGAWKSDGPLIFYRSAEEADSSFIRPFQYTEKFEISAITLDTFVRDNNIVLIKLIKCDAEGAEPEVLIGAVNTLRLTEFIAIDCGFERRGDSTLESVIRILANNEFDIVNLPFDNPRRIVVAANRRLARSLHDGYGD